jgi:hypothetical protein
MTTPSLDTSNPASVASGQPLACSSTLTSNSTHDLCLTQTIAVTNNASISIVTVIKTTQCDLFITGLDCGLCDVDKPHIRVPTVLLRVSALDPATTRAFEPADVTDGSVTQTLPYSARPLSIFLTAHNTANHNLASSDATDSGSESTAAETGPTAPELELTRFGLVRLALSCFSLLGGEPCSFSNCPELTNSEPTGSGSGTVDADKSSAE